MGMTQSDQTFDIAIAGGGPAGAAAAVFLARAGYRVGLVTLPGIRARIEGLSPRVYAILRANGLPLVGVQPMTQRHVSWGEFQGAQNTEHLVARHEFDRGLIDHLPHEGVEVWTGSIASVAPNAGQIRLRDGRVMTARLLFEARGRRAPNQLTSVRRDGMGPDTISIAGFIDSDGVNGSQILTRPEGWVWRARLGDGRLWQQVVTDSEGDSRGESRVAALWARGVGDETPLPADPVVSACALRLNTPDLDPRCPCLGDAAVALDPLSGHGMFWAMSSALMAPAIARAIFAGDVDLARDFYRNRVVDTFWRQARVGRDFHAASGEGGRFWTARRAWPDQAPAHPEVAQPRLEPRVISENGALTRAEVLVTTAEPSGAAFVMGQALAPIIHALGPRLLPDLSDFQQQIVPHLSSPQAAGLHHWLTTRGLANSPAIHVQRPEEYPTCDTNPAA